MDSKNKFSVGQVVYLEPIGNRGRYGDRSLLDAVVVRIGHKFLTVKPENSNNEFRFHVEGLQHDAGGYSPQFALHANKEQYEVQRERLALSQKIRKAFDSYTAAPFSLDAMRRIMEIVEDEGSKL